MPTENTTPNRGYQLPFETNDLQDDVVRLISALVAVDIDVAALLVAIATKAAAIHGHIITDTTGLQSALDAKQDALEKGQALGFAALDAAGKVPTSQLPAAVLGALVYQGTWNANTNAPTIPSASSANRGYYYKVAVAGTTAVDGINDWQVGDWIVSQGTHWDKIDNTDQVIAVAGLFGDISATALKAALVIAIADVSGLAAALDGKEAADANILRANVNKAIAAGFTATAVNDGAKSSGTYTPTVLGGNFRTATNGGAHALAAPTYAGDYTMVIHYTNAVGAGAITFSGFTKPPSGDPFTTTTGHKFIIYITKINGNVTATVEALQ